MNSSLKLGYASLIIATLFWGGNFVLGKVLSGSVEPITLTYLRWLPAFLILALLFYRQTLAAVNLLKPRLVIMWVLGILGVILFPATLYEGLKDTTALNASLYLAISPVLVLFLNRLIFKEKISPIILSGAIISLLGVLWLLMQGELMRLFSLSVNKGDLWAITSTVSWSVYCCVIRLRPQGITNTVFLTTLVGLAVITLTPFFIYEYVTGAAKNLANLTALQWSGIGYLVIGPSILSYAFWNFGIAIVGSAKSTVMTNFTPLFAAIFSIILLNEPVHHYHMISAILITLGVLICSYKKQR